MTRLTATSPGGQVGVEFRPTAATDVVELEAISPRERCVESLLPATARRPATMIVTNRITLRAYDDRPLGPPRHNCRSALAVTVPDRAICARAELEDQAEVAARLVLPVEDE